LKIFKRIAALTVAALVSFSYISVFADTKYKGFGEMSGQSDFVENAPSSFYYEMTAEHETHGLEKGYVLEYTPGSVLPTINYGDQITGRSSVEDMIKHETQLGKDAFACINASFYDMSTGVPIGVVIKDGILRSASVTNWTAIGFYSDGKGIISELGVEINAVANGETLFTMRNFNKTQLEHGVYLFNSDFAASTRSTVDSTEVVAKIISGEARLGTSVSLEVTAVNKNTTDTKIPAGHFVISAQTGGNSENIDKLSVGDKFAISFTADNSAWNSVAEAASGNTRLISDGTIPSSFSDNKAEPRTAVGIRADGTVVFFAVDGRDKTHSAGLGLADLAAHMQKLGCVNAVNMDGGGSTTVAVRTPGYTDIVITNKPSGGTPRNNSTGFVFVNTAPRTETAGEIYITPENEVVMPNSTVPIVLTATDKNLHPLSIRGLTPIVTVSGDKNSAIGTTAIIGAETGTFTISVELAGFTATRDIAVTGVVDEISVSPEQILSLPGRLIQLEARGLISGTQIPSSNASFTWELIPSTLGTVTSDGVITTAGVAGESGVLRVSRGQTYTDIPILLTNESSEQVYDFEAGIYGYTLTGLNAGGTRKNAPPSFVRFGKGAIQLDYNFYVATSAVMLSQQSGNIVFDKAPKALELWIYDEASKNKLAAEIQDINGNVYTLTYSQVLDKTGYQCLRAELPSEVKGAIIVTAPVKLMYNSNEEGALQTGSVYIDNFRAIYSDTKTDTAAPTVEAKTDLTANLNYNSTVEISVKDIAAKDEDATGILSAWLEVLLDGKKLEHLYNAETGILTFSFPSDCYTGLHKLSVTAFDITGNKSVISFDIKVKGTASAIEFADVTAHWAADYISFASMQGIVSGSQTNGVWRFRPDDYLNKAELAKIICGIMKLDVSKYESYPLPFADVNDIPDWAIPYIRAVASEKIIYGSLVEEELLFQPTRNVTRAEVMTVISRMLPEAQYEPVDTSAYSDWDTVPLWAVQYVENTIRFGIIGGYSDGTLRPLNNVRRSEIAKIIYTMVK